MTAYHYQCPSCHSTTHIDELPEGEEYIFLTSGLCYDCQAQQQQQEDQSYYDDDD